MQRVGDYSPIRQLVPADALSIVFVDNLGLDVTFSTISRVVAGRAMDLVVTFQVSDLKRNAGSALTNDTEAGRWDRFWFEGGDSYLDVDRNNFDQLNRRTRFSSVEHFIARRNQTKDFWFDPVATKSQPERAGVDSEPAVG